MFNDDLITQSIQTKIDKLKSFQDLSMHYDGWRIETLSFLKTIFNSNHHIVLDFDKVTKPSFYIIPENIVSFYENYKLTAVSFLESVVEQIKTLGITTVKGGIVSENKKSTEINITNNLQNSQHQNQSISFEFFIDVLKTELSNEQISALKVALDEYSTTGNFNKGVKFFKTLGDNVLANIVASFILNPNIINQLISQIHL